MEAEVGEPEELYGNVREPVIVVSDVHLGGKSSNYRDFWNFLGWLGTLDANGTSLKWNGTDITVRRPGTIVLLGDILELWDPRGDDRNYVVKDALTPISILNELDCDIIYVIGNHDEDLLDIKNVWKEEGVTFPHKGKGSLKIVYRTYPEPERIKGKRSVKGVSVGNRRYVFLHGHQFDRSQFFYRISRFLSKLLKRSVRFDPIDWHQDLTNVSFTRNIGRKLWNTVIFVVLFMLYGFGYFFWFNDAEIGTGGGILGGVLWLIISAFFVVTILPKIVTFLNTEVWRRIPGTVVKKCTSVEDVIKERYADKKGKLIDADVIVFGHTHNAGTYYEEEKGRVFINTGCWVNECAEEKRNTFLYIDTEAPYLLTWANGEITCLEDVRR